eukprot:9621165-Alexandrium_andersonii.AAC.1
MQIWVSGVPRFAQRPERKAPKCGGLRLSQIPRRGEGRLPGRAFWVRGLLGLEYRDLLWL